MNFVTVYKKTQINRITVMTIKPTIKTNFAVALEHSHSVCYVVFIVNIFY